MQINRTSEYDNEESVGLRRFDSFEIDSGDEDTRNYRH